MPTSSIVAIGDELVGGFTLDTNSHWMAERLRLLGYPVKRVAQIRDKPAEIIDGTVAARGPGLGLEWDEAAVAKYIVT